MDDDIEFEALEGGAGNPKRPMKTVRIDSDGKPYLGEEEFVEDGPAVEGLYGTRFAIGSGVAAGAAPTPPAAPAGMKPADMTDAQLIGRYQSLIADWTSGADFTNDADKVDRIKSERIGVSAQLATRGLLANPALLSDSRMGDYLAADVAYNSCPAPEDEDYAKFVEHRANMRDVLFGKERRDFFGRSLEDPNLVSADAYVRSAKLTQNMVNTGGHIDDQYDLIELRREAALEHFDDPRFVLDVAGREKGSYLDEVLIDFDRRDLMDSLGQARSSAMTTVFTDTVANRARDGADGPSMVKSFMEMREAGAQIRHNQLAVAGFGWTFAKGTPDHAMGLAALENTTYSLAVMKEFNDCFVVPQKNAVLRNIKSPVGMFQEGRKAFEAFYAANDPRAAVAFAVMERGAQLVLASDKHVRDLTKGSLEDASALFMFSPEGRQKHLAPVADRVENRVIQEMSGNGSLVNLGPRSVVAHGVSKKGEKFDMNLLTRGEDVHIDIVDGVRIRVARNKEDAEAGKFIEARLAGISVPKIGVQTKSGRLDAGEEAKAHLESLIARHGTRGMGIELTQDQSGHRVFSLNLSTGENLSQRMVRDGYALPNKHGDSTIRYEMLAKGAEANKRGLWKEGFVDQKHDWRSEAGAPGLSHMDTHSRLARTIAMSMAGNAQSVHRLLSHKETRIFALPLERWSGTAAVDREVMRVAKVNPGRLKEIYGNSMEILNELRERKGKLSGKEKLAHDRLTVGRNAIAQALVHTGHLSDAEAKKDEHALLSRKGLSLPKGLLDRPVKAMAAVADQAIDKSKKVARASRTGLDRAFSFLEM